MMPAATVLDSPEKPAVRTVEPLRAEEVPHDALYAALTRLVVVVGAVIAHVDKNTVDVHRDLERLRQAHARALDLLYPPPLPEVEESAIALYARALQVGDEVFDNPLSRWRVVTEVTVRGHGIVGVVVRYDGLAHAVEFHPGDLLVARRAAPKDPT